MDEKSILVIARYRFPQLLRGPLGGGVGGDTTTNDSTRADFHHYEYTKNGEANRDRDHEVARQQSLGVIAQVAELIKKRRLLRVLEDWCPPFPGFFSYYPSRRNQPAALTALINTLRL